MHGAPAVSYPVGRSRLAGAFLLAAWFAGAAGVLAWWLQVPPSAWRQAVALAAVLAGGAVAARAWARSPEGVLAWSGEDWSWTRQAHAETGVPEAVLDAQRAMLLRWETPAARLGARWFWVERRSDPARWDALRRAVYSRARPGAPRPSQPGREGRT